MGLFGCLVSAVAGTSEHMFEALGEAIDELDIPAESTALRTVIALHDRLAAKVTAAVGAFDRLGLWDGDGAPSMKAWLVDEGLAPPDAHRQVELGKRSRQLPAVFGAWRAGELSNGQVRAIVANLVDRHIARFQEIEEVLVPTLVGLSVKDTNAVMAEWRARADAVDDREPPAEAERSFHHSPTLAGATRPTAVSTRSAAT